MSPADDAWTDGLEKPTLDAARALLPTIPPSAATALGRIVVSDGQDPARSRHRSRVHAVASAHVQTLAEYRPADVGGAWMDPDGEIPADFRAPRPPSAILPLVEAVPMPLLERIVGSMELAVAALPLQAPLLPPFADAGERRGLIGVVSCREDGYGLAALRLFDKLHRDALAVAEELGTAIGGGEMARSFLEPDLSGLDEATILARHAAPRLAVGVAVGILVVRWYTERGGPVEEPAAAIAIGVGIAAALLEADPLPPPYQASLLQRHRKDYLFPRAAMGTATVTDGVVVMREASAPDPGHLPDAVFAETGLVAEIPGGVAIRTGIHDGSVRVILRVHSSEPRVELRIPAEIAEVSWTAEQGYASIDGVADGTPPWPGEYRCRVTATRESEAKERYELDVWAADRAVPALLKRKDALGFELRGEQAPVTEPSPADELRWVEETVLAEAATITVVTGARVDEVLTAFGANPSPEPVEAFEAAWQEVVPEPVCWMQVLQAGSAVIGIEDNGWQGSLPEVFSALPSSATAASFYTNVNGRRVLTLLRDGTVATAEIGLDAPDDPLMAEAVDGLEVSEFGDELPLGLLAIERFTGVRITSDLFVHFAGLSHGFRITPR